MDAPLRNLGNIVLKVGDGTNKVFDKFDSEDPIVVLPYRGYANEQKIFMKGRVLEDENIFRRKTDSEIRNIINNFKRFETDEIPETDVLISCNGQSFECKTDSEGYFTLDTSWTAPSINTQNNWVPVKVELLSPVRNDGSKITARGEVHLPFILIGDSAEEDADIYIDIAKEFSDRIMAVYIRQTRDSKNAHRIKNLMKTARTLMPS